MIWRSTVTLTLALAALAPARAQVPIGAPVLQPGETLLAITAEGQSRRVPDVAMFTAGVMTQGRTAGEALSSNATKMDEVVRALKRAGIPDRDIQTSAISLQPRYSNPEREAQLSARMTREPYVPPAQPQAPQIIGYEARNNMHVRARRLGEMGRVIDALVAAGANQVEGPSFTLDEPRAALDEARRQAVQEAQARAELYAKATGLRVSRIVSIAEGGGYYPAPVMARIGEAAGAPPPPPAAPSPVAPGELSLGASVSVQFALQR